jgi:hypothetical protein
MNAIHYDIAWLLSSNGIGQLGEDLFGGEWGQTDKQVLVLDGVGTPSELKTQYEQPSVQILVRGDRNEASHLVYEKAKQVSDFLLSLDSNVAVNSANYKGFEQETNIAQLGKDENERFVYSMNFSTYRDAF